MERIRNMKHQMLGGFQKCPKHLLCIWSILSSIAGTTGPDGT
jgi:hypothetical protein